MSVYGYCGKNYVAFLGQQQLSAGPFVLGENEDRIARLDDNLVLGMTGDPGDKQQFMDYAKRNITLHRLRGEEHTPMSLHSAAFFLETEISHALRSRNPYAVQCILGGVDDYGKPALYYVDELGTCVQIEKGGFGAIREFLNGRLDSAKMTDSDVSEALEHTKTLIDSVTARFAISSRWEIKILNADTGKLECVYIEKRDTSPVSIP